MAETMKDDDDMIVVIVGDEEIPMENDEKIQMPLPFPIIIKQEVLDDSDRTQAFEEILETVTKHGQFIEIKQEKEEYAVEYLEEEIPMEFDGVKDLINDTIDSDAEDKGYIPIKIDESNNYGFKKNLHTKCGPVSGPNKQFSLVQKLRKKFPEMKKNPQLLVEHLANIMKECKPPTPPPNFCKIIYDDDNVLKFECNICKHWNESVASAIRHYQDRHGGRYLSCYACGADFRRTTNLYKHEKRCTSRDARAVLQARGRFLGRKGRARPFLTRGKYARAATPPPRPVPAPRLYCSKCPASFVHKQNLESHENSHEGRRPFHCDMCPSAYTSETGLRRHLLIHGDSKFICDHCGRTFKIKPALISHLDTHRPIRKYGCSHCPRRFAQKNALVHHVNCTHLRLPPACGCPVCPKRYARMSHVKDHMKKIHGLTMMTRKMFYKALPTIAAMDIKEAQIVRTSDLNSFFLPPIAQEEKQKKVYVNKHKNNPSFQPDEIKKEKADSTSQHINQMQQKTAESANQHVYQIREEYTKTVNNDEQGQKVYELVLDKDENMDMMNEFLHFIQSKVEPGKVIKIQNGSFRQTQDTSDMIVPEMQD